MKFSAWCEKNNWELELNPDEFQLPTEILVRYPEIPQSWFDFVATLSACTNDEGTVWFLTQDDYEIQDDNMFGWDFIEKNELKKDNTDKTIQEFWDKHFPILFDIGEHCRYFAIHVPTGEVVEGTEPNFHETKSLGKDFTSFMEALVTGNIKF